MQTSDKRSRSTARWSIGRKLGFASMLMMLLVLLAGGSGLWQVLNIGQKVGNVLYTERQLEGSLELLAGGRRLIAALDQMITTQDPSLASTEVPVAMGTLKFYMGVLQSQGGEGEAVGLLAEILAAYSDLRQGVREVDVLVRQGEWTAAGEVMEGKVRPANDRLALFIRRLVRYSEQEASATGSQASQVVQQAILLLATLVALSIAAAMGWRWLVFQQMSRSIAELRQGVARITSGDLKHRLDVRTGDEIEELGDEFNRMAGELAGLIGSLEQRVAERTHDLERRTVQLEAATQVAREAAAIHDVGRLLDRTVHLISERFGFYHAGIFLLDEPGEFAVLQAASSEGGQRMLARGHKLQVGQVGIVGHVAASGQPRIALDVGEDAVFFDNPDLPQTRSEMALPLRVRERTIGVLEVQSSEPAAFSQEDIAVLQTLADQVALAIENARLMEETQGRLREIGNLLGRQSREGWREMTAERPAWGYAYDGSQVVPRDAVNIAATQPRLTMPLEVRGQSIGHLDVVLGDHPNPDQVALAQAVAEQAGLALENARLFQEMQRALAEAEALYRASRAIGEATSPQEIVQGAAEVAAMMGFSACSLTLITATDEEGVPREGDIYSTLIAEDGRIPISPLIGFALTDREAARALLGDPDLVLIYTDSSDPQAPMPDAVRETMRNMGMRGMVTAGLSVHGQPLGFLTFSSIEPLSEFPRSRVRPIRTIADQTAVAVENRRLFEETLRRAERERLRAEIASRVRASTDVDTILQTAVRELGRALRASEGLIRLGGGDGSGTLE